MRGWRARARPHGNSAVRPCGKTLSGLYTHGNSAVRVTLYDSFLLTLPARHSAVLNGRTLQGRE